MTPKKWKNGPQKLLIISPDPFISQSSPDHSPLPRIDFSYYEISGPNICSLICVLVPIIYLSWIPLRPKPTHFLDKLIFFLGSVTHQSELKNLYFIGLVILFMRDLPIFDFRLINPQELDSQVVSMSTMKMVSKKIFMDFWRNFTNSCHNTRTILCISQVKIWNHIPIYRGATANLSQTRPIVLWWA